MTCCVTCPYLSTPYLEIPGCGKSVIFPPLKDDLLFIQGWSRRLLNVFSPAPVFITRSLLFLCPLSALWHIDKTISVSCVFCCFFSRFDLTSYLILPSKKRFFLPSFLKKINFTTREIYILFLSNPSFLTFSFGTSVNRGKHGCFEMTQTGNLVRACRIDIFVLKPLGG